MDSGAMRNVNGSLSGQPPVINKQAALNRMGGDEQILLILAETFLEDAPIVMEQLEQAIQQQDATGIHFGAHKMKGLAANFDGLATTHVAAELEACGRAQKTEGLQKLWTSLVHEVKRLEDAIQHQILDSQS